MRASITRVSAAGVAIGSELVSSIERGLCVVVGFHEDDTTADIDYVVKKILNTKFFPTKGVRCERTVVEAGLEIICVSQPIFYAVVVGNRMTHTNAMDEERSVEFYARFLAALRKNYEIEQIKNGGSGAHLEVLIEKDGYVSIMTESRA